MISIKNKNITYILFALILILAFIFRVVGLSQRPMHGDEAINAFKLAELLETGIFKYDPHEYHGDQYFIFSLPFTYILQIKTLQELNETVLRFLPLLFGVGLFALLFFIRKQLTNKVLIFSSVLLALTPAFVFYSRYYIHEMLFAFFTYAVIFSVYSLIKKPSYLSASLLGISLGLWIATKETWIIVFAAMLFSFAVLSQNKLFRQQVFENLQKVKRGQWIFVIVLFVFSFTAIFSSFFQHMQGLTDFFSSFNYYFDKASTDQQHIYPVYTYLSWLINPFGMGLIGEGIILVLALAGCTSIFLDRKRKKLIYFLALFSLSTFVFYSIIPYKTPWNILSAWFGFVILAGYGFTRISEFIRNNKLRNLFYFVSIFLAIHLFYYSFLINHLNFDSPTNPYTFSQPQKEVLEIEARFDSLAANLDNSYNHYIEVISPGNDYWPLPWYLRNFKRIAWRDKVGFLSKSANIAIIHVDLESDYIKKLYDYPPPGKRDLYIPLFSKEMSIRPGLKMNCYIKKSLWDSMHQEPILDANRK